MKGTKKRYFSYFFLYKKIITKKRYIIAVCLYNKDIIIKNEEIIIPKNLGFIKRKNSERTEKKTTKDSVRAIIPSNIGIFIDKVNNKVENLLAFSLRKCLER